MKLHYRTCASWKSDPATASYCGKPFADFGAKVIRIEPPGRDEARQFPRMVDDGDGHRESACSLGSTPTRAL
ncbi:CoA transferase [Rhodopseudomonas sp. RCAM05734]|uniref:CoA transferase n=1 Tax=Rhodopseudomonas sp. RCAM05734 TaxID=3457549 RepID=UPI004043F98B